MSRPPRRQSGIGLIKEPGDGVGARLRYLSPNGFAVNGFDTLARTGGKGKASTGSARKGRGDERKALTGSARKGWGDVASIPQPDPSIPQDERGKRTNGGTGRTGERDERGTGAWLQLAHPERLPTNPPSQTYTSTFLKQIVPEAQSIPAPPAINSIATPPPRTSCPTPGLDQPGTPE